MFTFSCTNCVYFLYTFLKIPIFIDRKGKYLSAFMKKKLVAPFYQCPILILDILDERIRKFNKRHVFDFIYILLGLKNKNTPKNSK